MLFSSLLCYTLFGLLQTTSTGPVIAARISDTFRIVNGYQVNITDVPYQAAIRRRVSTTAWAHYCGAVVIHHYAVVTAAHCAEDYVSEPSNLRVNVGTSYRLSGGKSYTVSKVMVHEEYSSNSLVNDIALLMTASEIIFSVAVQPIKIASSELSVYDGMIALVSGYGSIEYGGLASSVLLAAEVNIVSQEYCSEAYIGTANVTPEMICASAQYPARDACQGDSGGPLVAEDSLIGLVSWGEGCANVSYPGVYTRVSEYYDWLNDKMLNLDSVDNLR